MLLCLKHSAIFFFICNVHVYNVVQLSYVYFRYTFPVSILLSSSQWSFLWLLHYFYIWYSDKHKLNIFRGSRIKKINNTNRSRKVPPVLLRWVWSWCMYVFSQNLLLCACMCMCMCVCMYVWVQFSRDQFIMDGGPPEKLRRELEEELKTNSEEPRSHAWYHGSIPRQVASSQTHGQTPGLCLLAHSCLIGSNAGECTQ